MGRGKGLFDIFRFCGSGVGGTHCTGWREQQRALGGKRRIKICNTFDNSSRSCTQSEPQKMTITSTNKQQRRSVPNIESHPTSRPAVLGTPVGNGSLRGQRGPLGGRNFWHFRVFWAFLRGSERLTFRHVLAWQGRRILLRQNGIFGQNGK